jgi:hypothetical protein
MDASRTSPCATLPKTNQPERENKMSEKAPQRENSESPGRFLRRVAGYLTEPDRRRMGLKTEKQMLDAIHELEQNR